MPFLPFLSCTDFIVAPAALAWAIFNIGIYLIHRPYGMNSAELKLSVYRFISHRNLNVPASILKSSMNSLVERERLIGTHENGPFLTGAH
ncbi:hypothetical protein MELB17_17283 [Marinobacter sp. ELB17]|nr:hypothetical protein MELB17_17283 [Marinobacter sp. ELB17]